jgi:uncharacterized integral membrane protein (TIGR00697 family)
MLSSLVNAFSGKIYSVSGFEKAYDGTSIVLYKPKNKRLNKPLRMAAKDIVKDHKLRLGFDIDDYTEIVSLAQRDSLLFQDEINQKLVTTFQNSQKKHYMFYPYFVAITAVVWCFAAIMGHRFMYLDLGFFQAHLPGAIVIFPIIYFMADVIQEVYGYTRARQTLWVCIAVHFLLGALTSSVMSFTPAPEVNELAYKAVLDTQWEMIIGNAVGMIAGFTVNGFILAKLKIKFAGKNLWLRTISSTFLAELVYSGVCSFIAFHNDLSILQLVKLQILMVSLKALWEVVFTPVLYLVCSFVKAKEGVDVYDKYTNFSPFSLALD